MYYRRAPRLLLLLLVVLGFVETAGASPAAAKKSSAPSATTTTTVSTTTTPSTTTTTKPPATTTTTTATTATTTIVPATAYDIPTGVVSDCSKPVDADIAAFLASVPDGGIARFGLNKCYAHNSVIVLTKRSNLTVEGNGSTFHKLTAPSPGQTNSQNGSWRVSSGTNVTVQHMTITGSYVPPVRGTAGQGLNYEHGVALWGVQGANVVGVTVSNVDGDCVVADPDIVAAQDPVIGGDYRKVAPTRNAVIDGLTCSGAGRQGVASTHAEYLTIKNSEISNVQQNGIDIEIDQPADATTGTPSEKNNHITIANNRLHDFYFSAIAIPLGQDPDVGTIAIRDNVTTTTSDTCYAALYAGDTRFTLGRLDVTGNTFRSLGDAIRFTQVGSGDVSANTLIGPAPNTACYNPALPGGGYPLPVRLINAPSVAVHDNITSGWFG